MNEHCTLCYCFIGPLQFVCLLIYTLICADFACCPHFPLVSNHSSTASRCGQAHWIPIWKHLGLSVSSSRCYQMIKVPLRRQIMCVCKIFFGIFWQILCVCNKPDFESNFDYSQAVVKLRVCVCVPPRKKNNNLCDLCDISGESQEVDDCMYVSRVLQTIVQLHVYLCQVGGNSRKNSAKSRRQADTRKFTYFRAPLMSRSLVF